MTARNLTLDAGSGQLNNQGGHLQATGSVSASGTGLNNQGGVIAANGQVTASAGSGTLTNTGGLVTGQNVTIGGAVNNSAGVISGSNSVAMTTLALNNDAGVIESGTGGISIDTQGNTLTNTNSGSTRGIVSQGAITIAAGDINNQAGYIGANGGLHITQSSSIDNQGGTLLGLGNSSVTTSGTLNNQGGSILSGADLAVSAATLNNSNSGTLYAGRDLTVTASAIDNSNTKNASYTTGLLAGRNATITAGTIDNTSGAIVSLGDTTVRATGSLNNTQGQIAGNTVTIDTPVLTNTAGRVDAQQRMTLQVAQFSADGVLASNGDHGPAAGGQPHQQRHLQRQRQPEHLHHRQLHQPGPRERPEQPESYRRRHRQPGGRHHRLAGHHAQPPAAPSTTPASSTAPPVRPRITAGSVNNTGRIYGDSIAITATTHNSVGAGGGAVIASRGGDVTINGQLNNTDGAQVFSLGSIQINGVARNDGSTINAMRNVGITGSADQHECGLHHRQRKRALSRPPACTSPPVAAPPGTARPIWAGAATRAASTCCPARPTR